MSSEIDKQKNECVFILDYMGIGGSERKIVSVANGLVKRGYVVHLVFLNYSYSLSNTIDESIKITVLDREGKLDFKAIKKLRQYLLDNENIQTMWPVNLYPLLYAYFANFGLKRKINIIGSSNKTVFRSRYQELQMLLYIPIIRSLDCFIFGSYNQIKMWKKKYFLGNKNYQVIHNGVDINKFVLDYKTKNRDKNRVEYGFQNDEIVIGMVARFSGEKAQDHLVKASHKLIQKGLNIKLLFAGDGRTQEQIKQLCQELHMLDRVTFTGRVEDVRPFLVCMDIFALTSVAVETFSNAALEGMAMELPIIISDLSGAREMVEDGVNGYVYPPGDIEKLAECIAKLTDAEHREKLAKQGREILDQKFTREIMIDNYQRFIWPE